MFRQTVSSSLTRSNMKWTAGSHASGSGSGKSTFTNRIKAYFGDDVAVLYHDNYYRCQDGVPFEQRVTVNYDHPDSLETDLLIEHLKELKAGRSIDSPVYDYSQHNRSHETVRIDPKPIIIVEGILFLADERLRSLLDIKIYVKPTRSKADVVINSGKNDVAFDLFVSKISQLLEEREKEN